MKNKVITGILILTISLSMAGCGKSEFSAPPSKNLDKYESKEAAHEIIWGDLEAYEGKVVWDDLTIDQQTLVHFPAVNRGKVFWVKGAEHYHAMKWCYAFEKEREDLKAKDEDIESGSTSEAVLDGETVVCSICIGTDPFPRLRKILFGTLADKEKPETTDDTKTEE